MSETLLNNFSTTLSSGVNNSATTIPLTSVVGLPSGTFSATMIVNSELMQVVSRSGSNLTVIRGTEGTGAVSHSSGVTIACILTARSLAAYVAENSGGGGGGSGIFGEFVPPDVSDFTWSNQGDAVATQVADRIVVTAGYATGIDLRVLKRTAPATPYTITAALSMFADCGSSAVDLRWGLLFKNGTLMSALNLRNNGVPYLAVPQAYSDYNTRSGSFASQHQFLSGDVTWVRLADDGTTRSFSVSPDGVTWFEVGSESHSADFTPNEVGIYIDPNDNSGGTLFDPCLTIWSYEEA